MPTTYTERQWNNQVRKAKQGWACYFKAIEQGQLCDIIYYEKVKELPVNDMSDYAKKQIEELLIQLKKQIECPICLETIDPKNIEMTACGHKYCKQCINTLKQTINPKCSICRTKIWVKR